MQIVKKKFNFFNKQNGGIAIFSPAGRKFDLKREQKSLSDFFPRLDLKAGYRLAVIMPQRPETALIILETASYFACAPVNPEINAKELRILIRELKIDGIFYHQDIVCAQEIQSIAEEEKAGLIRLRTENTGNKLKLKFDEQIKFNRAAKNKIRGRNIVFLLSTSGTTGAPKIIALTDKNIISSACNLILALKLTAGDRCLNLMPLYHVHGLMVAIATLMSGGKLFCAPKFNGKEFSQWLKLFRPTWFSASPAIQQNIVNIAKGNKKFFSKQKIRFIRSSSAPLAPRLVADLENIFHTSVSESYGMSEAALQITAHPLPPMPRKPGSVGKPFGSTKVKILDDQDNFLPANQIGEIIIKGDNVIGAYENNTSTNQESFFKGWLKTGDLGYFDEDSYLYIKGRIKEMINRGGEKIFPAEIDEGLLKYKAVKEAAAFAMPHSSLGEDVAAAVVLKDSVQPSEKEIKSFLHNELPLYKIPSRIIFVPNLPRTSAGKVKRTGLYETFKSYFNIKNKTKTVQNREAAEKILRIWQDALQRKDVSLDDNFFEAGGDSLKMTDVISRLFRLGIKITAEEFMNNQTIAELAFIYAKKISEKTV